MPAVRKVWSPKKKKKKKKTKVLKGYWQDRENERRETKRDSAAAQVMSEAAKMRGESLLLLPTP